MRPTPMLLFLAALLVSAAAGADPVVVVNARSEVEQLSQDEVINIFLGRYRKLPNGVTAMPVDQPEGSALRAEFYRRLVNKDLNEINAYWSRLVFSGKTAPPRRAANAAEVVSLLSGHAGGIAYVERGQVDSRLRIVLEFPR
jgi:ABC-type phosphate transport system substrate-binding protein